MEDFRHLVEQSERVFISAHISPDPDAIASVLVLGTTLIANYPDKKFRLGLDEEPLSLDFLDGYQEIVFGPVYEQVQDFRPDLFILLDGNNFERASRTDGAKLRDFIKANDIKVAVIDHHELEGKDEVDVFVNTGSPATSQDVYILCKQMGLKLPNGSAQSAMTGFYADTNGFLYAKAGKEAELFDFAKELVKDGASAEIAQNNLESYTLDDLKVLNELIANINSQSNCTYTYLSDDFIRKWAVGGHIQQELQRATHTFLNDYIRNIEHRPWGFIAYKSFSDGENVYTVSLRSRDGDPDVSAIAIRLGGGGHKPAAGARFNAGTIEDALTKIRAAIVK